jgi:CHAT domain
LRVEVRAGDEISALKVGVPAAGLEASATLAAPPAETAPRHLHLRISRLRDPESGGAYTARMNDGQSGWRSLGIQLREQDLRELNEGLRVALEEFRRFLGGKIDLEPERRASADYLARLDELARQGNYAFKQIFPDAGDQAYLRAALSRSESGGAAALEIATEDFFLPWEVLYDGYDPAVPPDPERFWGLRYVISRVLMDVRQTAPPVLDFTERPRVSLFADPGLPAVAEREIPFLRGLGQEERIALTEWRQENEAPGAELTEAQRRSRLIQFSATQESEVTHFACHAVAEEHGADSYLRLPRGLRLRIKDMVVEDYVLAGAPFVLLNACGTSVRDPLKTSDFVRRFLLSGGRGVLVTECDVPDDFAAAFVRRLYDRILTGEPLAAALLEVRACFLREHGNPLGLLYSAYLPLEARLNRRPPES